MLKDQRFNPIIVCVPLNIQNHVLIDENGNDTYQYFVDHGYKAINALLDDGSWFDLKKLEPDYLFHSRPYNYCMPKDYTSSKIVKYALICNVIYGTCLSENGLDVTLNCDYFMDVYTYYSFDVSEEKFYETRFSFGIRNHVQRCFPYGATDLEQMIIQREDKHISNYKKTVLWTPRWTTDQYVGGSNFFNYKELIFEFANLYQDVLFIIRPHPLMFSNFLKTGEMTEEEEKAFRFYCKEKPNIILDESKEYMSIFWTSDILITDASGIVPQYFITGKPILYCNTSINTLYTSWADKMIKCCYVIDNKIELTEIFKAILNGDDSKNENRECVIHEYFSHVNQNSHMIIDSLIEIK